MGVKRQCDTEERWVLAKGVHLRWEYRTETTQSFEGKRSLKGREKVMEKYDFRLGVCVKTILEIKSI